MKYRLIIYLIPLLGLSQNHMVSEIIHRGNTFTKDYIIKEGNVCETYEVNMTDKENVDDFFKKIIEKHSTIDILVNNVGRSEPGDPETMTFETWHELLSNNWELIEQPINDNYY